MFDFIKCADWLQKQMKQIALTGIRISSSENASPDGSVRFRLESEKKMGELVVWQNGNTSIMVYDLAVDKYIVDKHDIVLRDDCYDVLQEFIDVMGDPGSHLNLNK